MTIDRSVTVRIPEQLSKPSIAESRGVNALHYGSRQFIKAYVAREDYVKLRMLALHLDISMSLLTRFVMLQIADAILGNLTGADYKALHETALEEIADADASRNGE